MRTPGFSEAEAKKASGRQLFKEGWHLGRFREAAERVSRSGTEMIEVLVAVTGAGGKGEREFRNHLTGAAGLGVANCRR
jgi:hypothetical protein